MKAPVIHGTNKRLERADVLSVKEYQQIAFKTPGRTSCDSWRPIRVGQVPRGVLAVPEGSAIKHCKLLVKQALPTLVSWGYETGQDADVIAEWEYVSEHVAPFPPPAGSLAVATVALPTALTGSYQRHPSQPASTHTTSPFRRAPQRVPTR
ncbi:MAG: hypothetical protein AAF413_03930 [Patescibacteria group bacterium]